MTATLFGMLRHGETEWNRQKRIQGQGESPLTPEGRDDAMRWGESLPGWGFSRMVCSDLGRAVDTATYINTSLLLHLEKDPRLREQDWGQWSGRLIRDIRAEDPELLAAEEQKGWDFTPPGGESRRQVLARALQALRDIASRHPGERILIVSHKGVLRTLAHHLLQSDYTPESLGGVDPVARGKLLLVERIPPLADVDGHFRLLDAARPLQEKL